VFGENGTGKELVARSIHGLSKRHGGPFIEVNCAAIPEELIESELFGHTRGAFTGAVTDRRGKFEVADGGTLFLDEIGDMSLKTQAKVLRVLQDQVVEPVGSTQRVRVDVRVIAATNKDLPAAIKVGQFREDLYFRLAVGMVRVPPLRAHLEDLPHLLQHLWDETFRTLGLPPRPYTAPSAETLRQLSSVPWRGNVRELRNFVERSVAMSGALDTSFAESASQEATPGMPSVRVDLPYKEAKEAWLDHFESTYLRQRLSAAGGNVSQMAREAEVDRAHVIKLLRKHAVR
jgi:transcriptional regulator with GAF, ATPase, and Fis domain